MAGTLSISSGTAVGVTRPPPRQGVSGGLEALGVEGGGGAESPSAETASTPAGGAAFSISTVLTDGVWGSSSLSRSGLTRPGSSGSNRAVLGLSKAAAGISAGNGAMGRPCLGAVSPASRSSSQYAATVRASGRASADRVMS